jgi:ABC-type sulfate transport system permease component
MGATAIASVMLTVSFALLLFFNGIQWWMARKYTETSGS